MKIDEMVEFEQLKSWLGYSDQRSVVRWCEKRFLPILHFGLKRYVSSQLLTQYIDNQLVKFVSPIKPHETATNVDSENAEQKSRIRISGTYRPNNEIITKYLSKYENDVTIKTARKK